MQIKSRLTPVITLLLALITLAATAVYAQQRMREEFAGPGPLPGPGGMEVLGADDGVMRIFRMAEELNLTREQRDAIFKLIDEARPLIRENTFKLIDTRKELRDLMTGDKPADDKKLRALTTTAGDAMTEVMYRQLQLQSGIRGVLTAEQWAKARDLRDQGRRLRRDRMSDRRELLERFRGWRQGEQGSEQPPQN